MNIFYSSLRLFLAGWCGTRAVRFLLILVSFWNFSQFIVITYVISVIFCGRYWSWQNSNSMLSSFILLFFVLCIYFIVVIKHFKILFKNSIWNFNLIPLTILNMETFYFFVKSSKLLKKVTLGTYSFDFEHFTFD